MHRAPLVAAALLSLTACDAVEDALTPKDSAQARAAVESVALTRLEATLLMAIADVTPLDGRTPEEMAAAVEAALPTVFEPDDCVRAETLSASVTMTLDGCAGPRALSVSGVANVIFAAEGQDSVALTLTATDIELGDATMTINATGAYIDEGVSGKRIAVTTEGLGTAPGGTIIGRLGAYTAAWTGECYRLDGQWTSSLDRRVFATSVDDYYACDAYCPASGSLLYGETDAADPRIDFDGAGLTITYLGDDAAPWVATDGSFGRQALTCTADPQEREDPTAGGGDDDDDIDLD